MPPVSISSKATPFHSVARRLRSRVTPGSAAVTASLPPTRRLTRVLLPTLGKPTTATVGSRAHASARSRGQGDDPADDLFEAEAGGVELDRVLGGAQGAVLALGVAGVAAALGVEHRLEVLAGLGRAAAGALLVGGGEEDLQRRLGADHGADVAALGDVVAGGDQLPAGGRPSPRAPPGGRRRARRRRSPRARGSRR